MRDHGVVVEKTRLTGGSCSSKDGEKARICSHDRDYTQGLHVELVHSKKSSSSQRQNTVGLLALE
jgi:hypothetical protein